jgi:general secretion pathway protein A
VYTSYYEFTEPPFNLTPDPRFLFFSDKHREAFNHLLFGIQHRKGFLQLTGEVGSGKTTLCRALLGELGDKYVTALVLNPMFSETQLLRVVLKEFGVPDVARDRLRNYESLNAFLLERVKEGRDAVLIIDEAQDLGPGLLEQVRLLSNLETDNRKLIQIVLMGQPELRAKLNDPGLRQLRQRITVRFHLGPLTEPETQQYIDHRMAVAGGRGKVAFEPDAVTCVHRYSGGIPRLINALADKALLAGFVYRAGRITAKMVRVAEKELEGDID